MYKLLTIIIVCYWIICGYNDYDRVKVICDVINSPNSKPTIDESIWIEDISRYQIFTLQNLKSKNKVKYSIDWFKIVGQITYDKLDTICF